MSEEYEKYLEGNYDVGRIQEQENEDNIQAKEINAEIEKMKIKMRSQLINEAVKEKGISVINSRGIEGIYNDYVNKEKEYLVDGAVLKCNQATWDDFPVPGGNPVVLNEELKEKKKLHTTLCVSENPISSNGLIFATVGDAIKDINIIPFKCNCKIEADRESEIEKIKNDESCSEHGVCRHLMQLNSEWENVALGGSSYLSKRDISGSLQMDNYYLQQVRYGIVKNSSIVVEKEGLNMCSILFCKHGGIITPVHSGQNQITGVSEELIGLLKKYETGMDKNGKFLSEGEPALYPYHGKSDPAGTLTIGWGHAMDSFKEGWFEFNDGIIMNLYDMYIYDRVDGNKINQVTSISKEQAEEILQSDIKSREETLNNELETKEISARVNQRFYDALFMLTYQMGTECLTIHKDLPNFLTPQNFDPWDRQEIKEQFGEYSNHLEKGTMRRRADELDIIFDGDYERDYDEKRYGDIWRKKTYPNKTTEGY